MTYFSRREGEKLLIDGSFDSLSQQQPGRGRVGAGRGRAMPCPAARPGVGRHPLMLQLAQTEIIPRLVARHSAGSAGNAKQRRLPAWDGKTFVDLADDLLGPDPTTAITAWSARLAAHAHATTACLDLLTDAARHLGILWVEDRLSFAEVTMASLHLQRMLHQLALTAGPGVPRPAARNSRVVAGSCLLVAVPGEQHTLGVSMLGHVFRQNGWQVAMPAIGRVDDVRALVVQRPFDMIGLSMSADAHLPTLETCIGIVRRFSRQRDVFVMVGGQPFLSDPLLASRVGADASAVNAELAVATAADRLRLRRSASATPATASRWQTGAWTSAATPQIMP